jgi:hypothetical protein
MQKLAKGATPFYLVESATAAPEGWRHSEVDSLENTGFLARADKLPEPTKKIIGKPFSPDVYAQFHRGGRYFELRSKVAKQPGISQTHVSNVASGRARGNHVLTFLISEMKLIDAEVSK